MNFVKALPTSTAFVGTILLSCLVMPGASSARPSAKGPYAQADIGAAKVVGNAKSRANIGPAAGFRLGSEVFQWLALGVRMDLSSHQATLSAPPQGEFFQFYGASAELRLTLPAGPLQLFAEGSLGYSYISTNLLESVDLLEPGERFSPSLRAGGGVSYQLQNRHFSLGIAGSWSLLPGFESMDIVTATAFWRYTL